ncbi:hypothetical protein RND81_11G112900 [Saponaria officinalis]|uniref:Uncharacterized protein n=1 Tax=Saponaria officinalis TaxID=3572 RepID=A0AAW1HMG5_SAPOF
MCHLNLPEGEFIKIAQNGLSIPFRKRFDGSIFRDFIELIECVIKYEQVLLEESRQKHQAFHTVDVIDEMDNACEVSYAEVVKGPPFQCTLLEKKEVIANRDMKNTKRRTYTFDLTKLEDIFWFLHSNGKIKLKGNHKIPQKQDIKGKTYCLWHNATTHTTNNCVVFRNVLQDLLDEGQLQFASNESVKADDDPFSVAHFDLECNTFDMTEIQALTTDLIDNEQEEVAQRLFDRMLELRMLIFPKVEGIDMKEVCRWHMNEMHSTERCQTFRAFVAKQSHRNRLILTGEEARVMHLQTTEDVASAISGKVQEGESSKSYKEALKGEPQYPRLVQSIKYLRKGMCFGCADLLHFELIRMQAFPNDPSWVPAHQRRFTRFTKRGREMELAGVNRGPRGSKSSGSMRQPLEPTSAKVVNQSKTQQKKIAKQVAMATRSRFDHKLQQEAMIADMRVKKQVHQDKSKELAEENLAPTPCNNGPPKVPGPNPGSEGKPELGDNKKLNECTNVLGKLNDIKEGEYEDDMEGMSGDDLDLIVTNEDLKDPDIQFGSLDRETLECMVATLPKEFSAQSTLVKSYSQPSGMLECLSISKPVRSAGKDRELTDAEKDVLVRALFTRRGVDNQHSKALYLKVRLENKTVSKVLVDNGGDLEYSSHNHPPANRKNRG